ncbi:hypothetical protein GJ496_007879 [Pomphorhynchus laevis]|nr:hypothetical protein GJ496_007879 [Pomphorhynchus laevis]
MVWGCPSKENKCCNCNGQAAVCRGCRCAKSKKNFVNCSAPNCKNQNPIVCFSREQVYDGNDDKLIFKRKVNQKGNLITQSGTAQGSSEQDDNIYTLLDNTAISFNERISIIYDEVCKWRPNLLMPPICEAINRLIDLLTNKYADFAYKKPNEATAFK